MSKPDLDRVLVVIGRTRHKMLVAEMEQAAARGWSFLELRLDFLSNAVDFKRLVAHKKGPWVATLRRPADGGRWAGGEDQRQAILRQAIVAGCFEWVDLELDIAKTIRRFGSVKRIISYHNTVETPADIGGIYASMLDADADVVKIATLANSPNDVARILKIQREATRPTVAFCMGEIGFLSRFTALRYGAPFLYAAFNSERAIAPGLPCVDTLKTTYPVRSIDADTMILGVVGDPIGHSLSPVLHNHMLMRSRSNAIYLPMRVPQGSLAEAVKAYDSLPVQGYSVTLPLKEEAARLARDSDSFTQTSHSANTLIRKADGAFAAYNTDYTAAIETLKHVLSTHTREDGTSPSLAQIDVLILGSGGVARAIAHGLHAEGAHITIAGRNYEKTHKLAEEVHCKAIDWQGRHNVRCEVVINCTPIGMHPKVDETPVHHSFLAPNMVVFDTVYTPETTMLIREAKSRGCKLVTGVEMFVRQAARQFELFTNRVPDLDKMRDVVRKALSPISKALEEEAEAAATGD